MSDTGIGFVELVVPDVGKIVDGGVESVTPILWLIILGLSAWVIAVAYRRARQALKLVREALRLANSSTSTSDPRARRAELALVAPRHSAAVRSAWADFDGTLVISGTSVHASVPAESFFTEQRFAPGLIGNRVLGAAPTVLTTLGLFGTFLGLTVGLRGLDLGSTPEELRVGIQTLVNGAALGFTASLWGVFMSLVTNVVLRLRERKVLEELRQLQVRIDALFPLKTPEQSLSDIAVNSSDSNEALQVLHEKVGSALQETVQHIGQETSRAVSASVSEAIHDSLTPIIRELAERSVEHSAEVFKLVSAELTSSFREMGLSLAHELKSSSESMRSTLDHMGVEMARHSDEHAQRLEAMQLTAIKQSRQLHETSAQALGELQRAVAAHVEEVRATTAQQLTELQVVASEQTQHMQETSTQTLDALQRASYEHLEELRTTTVEQSRELQATAAEQARHMHEATTTAVDGLQRASASHLEELRVGTTQTLSDLQSSAVEQVRVMHEASIVALERTQQATAHQLDEIRTTTTHQAKELQNAAAEQARHMQETSTRTMDELQRTASEQARLMQETSARTLDDLQRTSAQQLEAIRTMTTHQMSELRNTVTTQLRAVNEATERQLRMLDESLPKVVAGLEQAATVVGAATGGMESISDNLARVATEIGGTSTTLARILADAIETMDDLADKTTEAATALVDQQNTITELTQKTAASVEALQKASSLLKSGFTDMRVHQESFLESLNRQLVEHSKTTAGWLADYAEQVSKQTGRRMSEWDTQTEKFTSNMLTAIEALSHAIDEYDTVRRLRGATAQASAA